MPDCVSEFCMKMCLGFERMDSRWGELKDWRLKDWRRGLQRGLGLLLAVGLGLMALASPAWAGLNDDRYDGNIFALYAGNGSLVPPRFTLPQALQQDRPALMVIYVDDNSDCKQFVSAISQLQGPYGWAMNILPIMADSIPVQDSYAPNEPGYYFDNAVPKTVIFDAEGQVVYNHTGSASYQDLDDVLREVFDLLPRSESEELRRRSINEVNTELAPNS